MEIPERIAQKAEVKRQQKIAEGWSRRKARTYAQQWAIGYTAAREESRAWNARRKEAEQRGELFDEPFPGSEKETAKPKVRRRDDEDLSYLLPLMFLGIFFPTE